MLPTAMSRYRLLGADPIDPNEAERVYNACASGTDDDFGDTERRRRVERGLLRKLDLRVIFLVLCFVIHYREHGAQYIVVSVLTPEKCCTAKGFGERS
ncbi:hypothetical protein ID866_9998 [Astraeus odoratus]|nr:hypothetical protein ID866_9998 [Astraeus odoratus]